MITLFFSGEFRTTHMVYKVKEQKSTKRSKENSKPMNEEVGGFLPLKIFVRFDQDQEFFWNKSRFSFQSN